MKILAARVLLVFALALGLPAGSALAQQAYATTPTELRAGPGPDYPVVAVVAAGQPVWVQGCVTDYSWCDVVAGAERGWVYAGYIQTYYDYQTGYVPLLYYGAVIGVAAYPFYLYDYWGRYYVNRPWYGQRFYWSHHHPSHSHPRPMPYSPAAGYNDRRPPQHPQPIGALPRQPHGTGGGVPQPHGTGGPSLQPHATGGMPGLRGVTQPGLQAPATIQQPRAPGGAARPGSTINLPSVAGHPSRHGARPAGPGAAPHSSGGGGGWPGPRGR